jgi:hypothetical protein
MLLLLVCSAHHSGARVLCGAAAMAAKLAAFGGAKKEQKKEEEKVEVVKVEATKPVVDARLKALTKGVCRRFPASPPSPSLPPAPPPHSSPNLLPSFVFDRAVAQLHMALCVVP